MGIFEKLHCAALGSDRQVGEVAVISVSELRMEPLESRRTWLECMDLHARKYISESFNTLSNVCTHIKDYWMCLCSGEVFDIDKRRITLQVTVSSNIIPK